MLERPAFADSALIDALRSGYDLEVGELTFLALGNDSVAWTYSASARDGSRWFVKVRRDPRPAGILVPRFLNENGMAEAVAVRETGGGEPWMSVGPWTILVYPLVDAPRAMDVGLDDDGWRHLGSLAARLHATTLPADLAAMVPREAFRPVATELARRVTRRVEAGPEGAAGDDPIAARLTAVWRGHAATIDWLVGRSEELAAAIRDRARAAPFRAVPCHADLHIGNVLVGADGRLSIVDWDEVVIAPPERDLMFVRGSVVAGAVTDRRADAFEAGYGTSHRDLMLIAWYQIDWTVQDLADFARRVLLDPAAGPATRARALELVESIFEPGGEVAMAMAADDALRRG